VACGEGPEMDGVLVRGIQAHTENG
jgi:hypothetical protein